MEKIKGYLERISKPPGDDKKPIGWKATLAEVMKQIALIKKEKTNKRGLVFLLFLKTSHLTASIFLPL